MSNTVEVNIIGRESVSDEIAKVRRELAALRDKEVRVEVKVDQKKLNKAIDDAIKKGNNSTSRDKLDLDVDRRHLGKAIRDAVKAAGKNGDAEIDVDVNSKKAKKDLAELKALLKAIASDDIDIGVDVNAGKSAATLAALKAAIDTLEDKDVDVNVNVDSSALDAVNRELDGPRSRKNITVTADTDDRKFMNGLDRMSRGMDRQLGGSIDRMGDRIRRSVDHGRDIDRLGASATRAGQRLNNSLSPSVDNVKRWNDFYDRFKQSPSNKLAASVQKDVDRINDSVASLSRNDPNFRVDNDYVLALKDLTKEFDRYATAKNEADRVKFGEGLKNRIDSLGSSLNDFNDGLDANRSKQQALRLMSDRVNDNLRESGKYYASLSRGLRNFGDSSSSYRRAARGFDDIVPISPAFMRSIEKTTNLLREAQRVRSIRDIFTIDDGDLDGLRRAGLREGELKGALIKLRAVVDDSRVQDQLDNMQRSVRLRLRVSEDDIQRQNLSDMFGGDEDIMRNVNINTYVNDDFAANYFESTKPGRDVLNEHLTRRVKINTIVDDDGFRALAGASQFFRNFGRSVTDVDGRMSGLRRTIDRDRDLFDFDWLRHGARAGVHVLGTAVRGFNSFSGAMTGAIGAATRGIPVFGAIFRGMSSLSTKAGAMGGPIGAIAAGAVGILGTAAAFGVLGTVGVVGTGALTAGAYATVAALGAVTGIASGVTAVVGGALAGAFIYFAAQAPEVSEAYKKLGENVSNSMKDMSKVVQPSLIRMADSLQGAFDIMKPSLEIMAKGTAELVDNMGTKLPSIARSLGPALEKAFESGSKHLNVIGDAMPGIIDGLGNFMERMGSPTMIKAAERVWGAVPGIIEKTGQAIEWSADKYMQVSDFLQSDELKPMRQGFSDLAKTLTETDWSSASEGMANAMNSFGSFLSQVDGENLSQTVGAIGDTFANLTDIATNTNLDGMFAGLAGALEGASKFGAIASSVVSPITELVELGTSTFDWLPDLIGLGGDAPIEKKVPVSVDPDISSSDAKAELEGLFAGVAPQNVPIQIKPDPVIPEQPQIPAETIPTPRLTGSADSLERRTERLLETAAWEPKVDMQVEALVSDVTGLDPKDFDRLGIGSRGSEKFPVEIPLSVATQIEELTGKPVDQVLGDLAGRPVNVDVPVNPNFAIDGEAALQDALGGMSNLRAAVTAELTFSNLNAAQKGDIGNLLSEIDTAIKDVPNMAPIVREQFTQGLSSLNDVIPNIPDMAIDDALGSFTAAIKLIPELAPAQTADVFNGLTQIMKIVPEIEPAAVDDVFQGATQIMNVLPKVDEGGVAAGIKALGEIALNIKPNMTEGDIKGVIDGAIGNFETAINMDVNMDGKIGNVEVPPIPAQEVPIVWKTPSGNAPTAQEFANAFSGGTAEVPLRPPRNWLTNPDGTIVGLGDPVSVPIDPSVDATKPLYNQPQEVPIVPPAEMPITSPTAIPPIEVQVLPKFDGAMNFGAIPPMEVQILPRFDGAMNFGVIPPMEVQILPKFDGAMNFGAIPPIEVQIIPKFDGAAAFGIIPPMEVQIIPKFDGAAAFGVIPPMEVQIIPKFDGAAAFGVIPPIEVPIIPKFDGAGLGSIALPSVDLPVTVTPTSFDVQVTANPSSIEIPVTPSEHTIGVTVGSYTLPGNTTSTHTISVVVSGSGLPGGGAAKSAFTGTGISGFGDSIPGLIGAAFAGGNNSASLGQFKNAGDAAGSAYGKGFSEGMNDQINKGADKSMKDLDKAVNKSADNAQSTYGNIPPQKFPGAIWDLFGRPTTESLSMGPGPSDAEIAKMARHSADNWGMEFWAYATSKGVQQMNEDKIAAHLGVKPRAVIEDFEFSDKDKLAFKHDLEMEAEDAERMAKGLPPIDWTPKFSKDLGRALTEDERANYKELTKQLREDEIKGMEQRNRDIARNRAFGIPGLSEMLYHDPVAGRKAAAANSDVIKNIFDDARKTGELEAAKGSPLESLFAGPISGLQGLQGAATEAINGITSSFGKGMEGLSMPDITQNLPDFSNIANQLTSSISQISTSMANALPSFNLTELTTGFNNALSSVTSFAPPPINLDFKSNVDQVMNDVQQLGSQFIQPHMDVLNNIPEVKELLEGLNGQDTESTHTVNMDVREPAGGGKAVGFASIGFAGIAGITGEFGSSGMAGVGGIHFSVNTGLASSMILIADSIRALLSGGWEDLGASVMGSFFDGMQSFDFGGAVGWLSGLVGGFFGRGMPTISVYENGQLISKTFAQGIRSGNKIIIKSADDTLGSTIFTQPKLIIEKPDWSNGINLFSGFNFAASSFMDMLKFRITSMSAGYLNEHGQMVVYNVYDQSTHSNHFDGGLVGDPEKQAKRVLDVLSTAHQGRRFQMVIGNGS